VFDAAMSMKKIESINKVKWSKSLAEDIREPFGRGFGES